MRSRDSYHLSPQDGGTPASSEDELEMETSFATFKPSQKGLVNPLYEDPLILQSVSISDAEGESSEGDGLDGKGGKKRPIAKAKKAR